MKRMTILPIMVLLLGLGCAGNQNGSVQLKEGAVAPDFSAQDQAGENVTLSELRTRGPVALSLLRSFS
jgi:ABC-type Fe3+-hydroxamate transport system substrate-binding protein